MNFYLATVFEQRHILLPVRYRLRKLGHTVTSSWLDQIKPQSDMIYQTLRGDGTDRDRAFTCQQAQRDLDDIDAADVFVVFIDKNNPSPRGGMHIETGYALGKGKPVWLVGDQVSHFHWIPWPRLSHFCDVKSFLHFMESYGDEFDPYTHPKEA